MARARVETPTMPMRPSAKACFDDINSTKATAVSPTPAAIWFFDEHTCYLREQLENHDDDGLAAGRKIFRPKCVAIGPRFHGKDDLKRGQELKRLAAWDFWECSDQPFSTLYAQVEAVASEARASYGSSAATADFTDEEFTAMMFVDGCFLLQLIAFANNFVDGGLLRMPGPGGLGHDFISAICQIGNDTLSDDIFMVENQIPWVVLNALMAVRPIQVMLFIDRLVAVLFDKRLARPEPQHRSADDYGPIHLLDLLYKRQTGRGPGPARTLDQLFTYQQLEVVTLTSATELGEAGVDICPSRTPRFADIGFWWRWPVFGRLSLPPIVLGHTNLTLLLNMLALELFNTDINDNRADVATYLGILSALMVREEDVRELRRKGIVQTTLSDKEVMKLFKKLEPHTCTGAMLTTALIRANMNDFFKRQWMWIAIHRFVYNNLKFLVAIGSFLSVSLSILKAILALPAGSSNN